MNKPNKEYEVLYIHSTKDPRKHPQGNTYYGIMPMGIIGILNTLIKNGVSVLGVNIAIEKALDPDFDIGEFLSGINYKILLTDLHWYEHSFGTLYIAEQSKKIHPLSWVIIGGYTSTIYAEEILTNFNCVDYITVGDCDKPLPELVYKLLSEKMTEINTIPNLVYRNNNITVRSKIKWIQESISTIDFVNTDFFWHSEYIPYITTTGAKKIASHYWLLIARGCKYNCSYCCGANSNMNDLFQRCNILLRSPKEIANDFNYLTEHGIKRICPSHDIQMFGSDFYCELFHEIGKQKTRPGMYLECFQLPDEKFLDAISEVFDLDNLVLAISPISGNEQLRKSNGKLFSNKRFIEILEYIKQKRIRLQLYYTLNIYGETKQQFLDTYNQMSYIINEMGLAKKSVFYQSVIIDPLAGMRNIEGIDVKYNSFMDYYSYCLLPENVNLNTGFDDNADLTTEEKRKKFIEI